MSGIKIKRLFFTVTSLLLSVVFFCFAACGKGENEKPPKEEIDPTTLFEIDGNVISFGLYPQSLATETEAGQTELFATPYEDFHFGVDISQGETYSFSKEKIRWLIIEKTDDGYTALSEKILDSCAFAEIGCAGYENSIVKAKVAEIYGLAFTDTEKEFVTLSIPAASIIVSENAVAEATDYAIAKGLRMWGSDLTGYERNAAFWLSDKGQFADYYKFVDFNGKTDGTGYICNAPYFGVRPVIRINLKTEKVGG